MASVNEIATTYIEQMAEHDPIDATAWGIPGYDDRLPDLSPTGLGGPRRTPTLRPRRPSARPPADGRRSGRGSDHGRATAREP
jgi:hypothetical protein